MLVETQDDEQVIARVAALDIGKAGLVCCVRVPDEDRPADHSPIGHATGTLSARVLVLTYR